MQTYSLAGQEFQFFCPVPELVPFETFETKQRTAERAVPFVYQSLLRNELISRTQGWVANAQRQVEIWTAPPGLLLRVSGVSDFYISPDGRDIQCASREQNDGILSEIDRQMLLGPVLVLALALRGTWCLHASATIFNDSLIVFLGESGQGKSTLAASLVAGDHSAWRLVADDILPVTLQPDGVAVWPRFPQLKLPVDAQPGVGLPERIMLSKVCVLADTGIDEKPGLQLLSSSQTVQIYLGHTAGTRLFGPELLVHHLDFCAQAAGRVPVYRLDYPHRREALSEIKELLESIC